MDKVKLAWSQKYGAHAEEFSYMEKIFQTDINIPQPTAKQVIDYIHFLNPQILSPFVDLISIISLRNPRKIKRLLNVISIRAAAAKKYPLCHDVAFLWTIAEQLMGKKELLNLYNELGGANEFYNFLTYAGSRTWGSAETE